MLPVSNDNDLAYFSFYAPYKLSLRSQMQRRELLVVAALVLEIKVRFLSISSKFFSKASNDTIDNENI